MARPIVVGFDGSDHARDALALGRTMATALDARLVVVCAYTPEEWLWAPGTAEPMDADERERVEVAAEQELSADDRCEFRTVPSPSAAGAIHAAAEAEGAQLIVVGSTHRGSVGQVLLGTVTQQALDAAPCSVLVAPAGAAARSFRLTKIGVGFDDTPQAHDALSVAALLARQVSGELRIIWAAHLVARALPAAFTGYMRPNYLEEVREGIEHRLERAAAPFRDELFVRTEIASGETVAALTASSEHLDVLVLGSRGYGPAKRMLLGSVSRAVLDGARCPVLTVPRGTTTLDEGADTSGEGSAVADPTEPSARV
jgi:nucleotide-binding universal stress UspA family protein